MAINITEKDIEKVNSISEKYSELEALLKSVDDKYNLNYISPVLDLPETLGLEKMTYEVPSNDQLLKQAEQSTLANYLKNLEKIQSSETENANKINSKIENENYSLDQALTKLQSELQANSKKAQDKAVTKGTARGSILESAIDAQTADFDKNVEIVRSNSGAKISELSDQLQQLAKSTQDAIDSLDKTRDADIQTALTKLLKEVQTQLDTVTKYNNTIDEKEQKYASSRETALYNAQQKEANRALRAGELYAKLGKVGYNQQISNEKITIVKDFLSGMSKSEATAILNSDNYLKEHLGQYYNYIVDWVSNLKD